MMKDKDEVLVRVDGVGKKFCRSLIALGAGFTPILTGRSRLWTLVPPLHPSINGSVLGLTKTH